MLARTKYLGAFCLTKIMNTPTKEQIKPGPLVIHKINVTHPRMAVRLSWWQRFRLLLGIEVISHIEITTSVKAGELRIDSKPIFIKKK